MSVRVLDPYVERDIRRSRESIDAGHRDEIWDGVYYVMPDADMAHQRLVGRLVMVLGMAIDFANLGAVNPGGNISDQPEDWTRNYRVPDVSVFLNENLGRDRGSHWLGGPDLAIEVVSPNDLSREKLPFYAKVGTREVLIIDRDPWVLELYRLQNGSLELVGVSKPEVASWLASEVVPLSFRLIAGSSRPMIEVKSLGDGQSWTISGDFTHEPHHS